MGLKRQIQLQEVIKNENDNNNKKNNCRNDWSQSSVSLYSFTMGSDTYLSIYPATTSRGDYVQLRAPEKAMQSMIEEKVLDFRRIKK